MRSNMAGALVSQILTALSGLVGFYVLGNRFGPDGYGIFAASLSIATIFGPLAQVGSTHLSVHQRSRTGDANAAWAMTIGTQLVGGFGLAICVALLQPVISPGASRQILFVLILGEVAFVGLLSAAVVLAETGGKAAVGAQIKSAFVFIRFAALGIFWISDSTDLATWVWFHAGSGLLGMGAAIYLMQHKLDIKPGLGFVRRRDVKLGASFAAGQMALSTQNDADKAILAFNGLERGTGVYAAGYRIGSMAELPIQAMVASTYGQFFEAGKTSVAAAHDLAVRMSKVSLAVSIPSALCLIAAAPALPILFPGFEDSVNVVRLLAPVLPLKGLQAFAGNALAGSDQQPMRLRVMVVASLSNATSNFVLIPHYGISGAIASTVATEIGISIALWLILRRLVHTERTSAQD